MKPEITAPHHFFVSVDSSYPLTLAEEFSLTSGRNSIVLDGFLGPSYFSEVTPNDLCYFSAR